MSQVGPAEEHSKPEGRWRLRDRLSAPLRGSRIAAALELLVVPLLLGLQATGVLAKPKLPLLLFGGLSMWLRRVGWRQIGLSRPASWRCVLRGPLPRASPQPVAAHPGAR